jgi:hypothetical protein
MSDKNDSRGGKKENDFHDNNNGNNPHDINNNGFNTVMSTWAIKTIWPEWQRLRANDP